MNDELSRTAVDQLQKDLATNRPYVREAVELYLRQVDPKYANADWHFSVAETTPNDFAVQTNMAEKLQLRDDIVSAWVSNALQGLGQLNVKLGEMDLIRFDGQVS